MATGDYIWTTWTSTDSSASTTTYSTCSSDIASSSDTCWHTWNDSTATTITNVTYSIDSVWVTWTSDSVQEETFKQESPQYIPAPSKEELKRRKLRREQERRESEERQKRYEEMERKRKAAEEKAKQLLLDLIGEDQLKVYEETGRVFVKGRKQDYIVQKQGTVIQVQKDKLVDMCVHLENKTKYPETDNVVAMKIMLETDEDRVLKLANQHDWTERDKNKMPLAACM